MITPCRIYRENPNLSCLCDTCHRHRAMIIQLRLGTRDRGLLNQSELVKIEETRKLIRSGVSLFEPDKIKAIPGKVEPKQKVVKVQSHVDVKKLEKKWKSGSGTQAHMYLVDHPDSPAKDWFPEKNTSTPKPGEVECSFCGKQVSSMNVTHGRGMLRQIKVMETVSMNPLVRAERVKFMSEKLTACPDCCLKIKPSKDRYGKIQHSNVRTYDEG